MCSKGSRFTGGLGVEGVFARCCPTVRNRLQPFAGDRVRPLWPCLWYKFCKRGHFWRLRMSVASFRVAGIPQVVGSIQKPRYCYCCCSFRTLVRAHRKRRSTAGHGGFYVISASVRRVSRHHGVGWGGAVMTFLWTLDLITLLMLRQKLGWGGVRWGSDDVPLDLITLLMLRHALVWGGVWWGVAVMTFLWT